MFTLISLLCGGALAQEPPPEADPTQPATDEEQAPEDSYEEFIAEQQPAAVVAPPTTHLTLGASLGASWPLGNPFTPGPAAQLEAGLALPMWGGRLRPLVALDWAAGTLNGQSTDPRLAEPYSYAVRQDRVQLGLGLAVSVLPQPARINPEFTLLPRAVLARTTTSASSGGTELGSSADQDLSWGWAAAAGARAAVGPGHVVLRVGVEGGAVDSVLTGPVSTLGLLGSLGYRLALGPSKTRQGGT